MTFITDKTVKNSYFLRDKNNKNLFLHPLGETKDAVQYILKKGTVGAAIWSRKAAKKFIKSGFEAIEMVKVEDVLNLVESKIDLIIKYIDELEASSMESYTEEEKSSYLAACFLIKKKAEFLKRKKS